MSAPSFFQTHMGQRFYEGTMPALVRELKRLNDNIERLVAAAERFAGQPPASSAEPTRPTTPGNSEGE
ncbi:hypothetical protein FJV41_48860 [Myxococcus llanfairpwllgwyngyllgogerychwyrndrobwllllantysiliogogogochensis]|uniref:Uncharacterized protein n=1 Tax=Myxococcus llanfairpwllgwyngyllgogerychwyrndrobwllllantysiliogogogochensis TaxID=2590453 RepID=A0A540WHY3_9BACT|nr:MULTISPECIES: hypothetical protein [Myxococcus]MCP3167391.1 hypothetical protein [Myxococcus qinghaiensis]TQF08636.1 hypothetical protein FJV41_48860 [Myxococcus llanfairpwllgwyngyllgogerychwyrndrobwllllantysiliogogogochensis]